MPGGTWFGLETARWGLRVNQQAMNVTGHNLANASTPGYTRQEAVIKANMPYTSPDMNSSCTPGQFGTGAQVEYIRRIKDEYMDNNVRRANADSGYWEDQISIMQRAEASFAEPATKGIDNKITDFFKSWMNLNAYPTDMGVKATVMELGRNLAVMMGTVYKQLQSIEKGILDLNSANTPPTSGMLQDQVNQVSDILTNINDLTTAIKRIYDAGQQPNDLLDKRDMLLEKLSHYGPVTISEGSTNGKPNGELEVNFFGNKVFDSKNNVCLNDVKIDFAGGTSDPINITFAPKTVPPTTPTYSVNLTQKLNNQEYSGSLVGLVNARETLITEQDKLDKLSIAFTEEINKILKDTSDPSNPYDYFFGVKDSVTHIVTGSLKNGTFNVNDNLIKEPSNLDGSKAFNAGELRDHDIPSLGNNTFSEYCRVILTDVGNAAKNANNMAANQEAIKIQITALRDSISGVDTDEELTKMTQFQHGFNASARMVTVIDEMIDLVINRMGV